MKKNFQSASKITTLVLAIVFGLIALTLTFAAFARSTELRSKAAVKGESVRQWDFNNDAGGWKGSDHTSLNVQNGMLNVSVKPAQLLDSNNYFRENERSAFIENDEVNTKMPQGSKYIEFNLTVKSSDKIVDTSSSGKKPTLSTSNSNALSFPQVKDATEKTQTKIENKCIPLPSWALSNPKIYSAIKNMRGWCHTAVLAKPFNLVIYYQLINKKDWEKPLKLTVDGNGKAQTFTARLPETHLMEVQKVKIEFGGFTSETNFGFDWIRVVNSSSEQTSCQPRPKCLDAKPPCQIAAPLKYCDATPTSVPSSTNTAPTVTSQ